MADHDEPSDNVQPDAADAQDCVSNMLKMKAVPDPIIIEPPTPPPTPLRSPMEPPRVEAVPPPTPPQPEKKAKKYTADLMDIGFQDQRVGTPTARISSAVPRPLPASITSGPGLELRSFGAVPEIETTSTACACI